MIPKSPFDVPNSVHTWIPKNRFLSIAETIIEHQNSEHTAIDSSTIKVLNWNIAKQNYQQDWIQDFRLILQQHQPNLICLQEVRMCQMTRQAIALLQDMSWSFAPNFIDAHHKIYAGVLIAARAIPLRRRSLFSLHHEPISKTPKVSLIKEYPLVGQVGQVGQTETLLVINSHLINFVTLNKFKSQLRGIEEKISHHRGLIIFAGDFNTWNEARAVAMQTMMTRLGLIQVRFSAQDTQSLKRFLLSPPLDYIFYRGLVPKKFSARVLNDFCSSDHKPMIVEFSS